MRWKAGDLARDIELKLALRRRGRASMAGETCSWLGDVPEASRGEGGGLGGSGEPALAEVILLRVDRGWNCVAEVPSSLEGCRTSARFRDTDKLTTLGLVSLVAAESSAIIADADIVVAPLKPWSVPSADFNVMSGVSARIPRIRSPGLIA